MSRGLVAGPRAHCLVADPCAGGGGSSRRAARMPLPPAPVEFPAWARYSKDDVFGLCDVLARAEQVLIRAGEPHEAAQVAVAFELLEGGLACELLEGGLACAPLGRGQSVEGANSIDRELTQ